MNFNRGREQRSEKPNEGEKLKSRRNIKILFIINGKWFCFNNQLPLCGRRRGFAFLLSLETCPALKGAIDTPSTTSILYSVWFLSPPVAYTNENEFNAASPNSFVFQFIDFITRDFLWPNFRTISANSPTDRISIKILAHTSHNMVFEAERLVLLQLMLK